MQLANHVFAAPLRRRYRVETDQAALEAGL